MFEAFVNINNVPTHVASWGKWIEEDLSSCKSLILFIPGNPGSIAFYKEFLETIYHQLGEKIPVWTIDHAGHKKPRTDLQKIPNLKTNQHLYNLNGQVEHKVAFINKYIPDNTKLYIISHSIGAYITLELLQNSQIEKKVKKCYLLFPTIEYMGETLRGKLLTNIVRHITWLVVFLTWIFSVLPSILQILLIKIYLFITNTPQFFTSRIIEFLKPNTIEQIIFMALDEMDKVKARNDIAIENNKKKIKLYYSKLDHWAPESYYRRLKNTHPDIDASICGKEHEHAFVLRTSKEMGIMVADWIKEDSML